MTSLRQLSSVPRKKIQSRFLQSEEKKKKKEVEARRNLEEDEREA